MRLIESNDKATAVLLADISKAVTLCGYQLPYCIGKGLKIADAEVIQSKRRMPRGQYNKRNGLFKCLFTDEYSQMRLILSQEQITKSVVESFGTRKPCA